MLLSTSTSVQGKIGMEENLRALKKAGFDAFDLGLRPLSGPDRPIAQDNYMEFAESVRKMAEEIGIVCNQAHATFPPEKFDDEEYNKATFERIRREMQVAAHVGAPIIVVHATKPVPRGYDVVKENLRFYGSLLPYAKEYGIKIGVENLFEYDELRERRKPCGIGTSEKLAEFYDMLDPEWFTVCFDSGHAAINVEYPEDAIRTLGKRIGCLHIHDNDFVNDNHLVPYMGKTNWDEVCRALADIGYDGDFTLESCTFENYFPNELIPDMLNFEVKVARYLMNKIESYKKGE